MNNEIRAGIKNIIDVLDLNIAFLKYTNKCAPENEQLNSINHILNLTMNIFSVFGYHQLLRNQARHLPERRREKARYGPGYGNTLRDAVLQ